MILNITAPGLIFRVAKKNLEIKTPTRLKFNESMLNVLMAELRSQNIHSWYITSDQNIPLRSAPKLASHAKNKKIIQTQKKLNVSKNVEDNGVNQANYHNKLDEIISLLKDIRDKETIVGPQIIRQPIEFKSSDKKKDEDFIPTIDLTDMEINTTEKKIIKPNQQVDDLKNVADDLKKMIGGNN